MNLKVSSSASRVPSFISIAALLLWCCMAPAAHAQGVLLRSKPATNSVAFNWHSNFFAFEFPMLGTNSTQLGSASNVFTSVLQAGTGVTITPKTNGLEISSSSGGAGFATDAATVLTNLATANLTNRWIYSTDDFPTAFTNIPSNSRTFIMPGRYLVTSRFIFSNAVAQAGANLFSRSNIILEAAVPGTVELYTTNMGDMLWVTNCYNFVLRNVTLRGKVITNYADTAQFVDPQIVFGALNLYNCGNVVIEDVKLLDWMDHGIQGTGANVGWNGASTNVFIRRLYADNIGSARTNAAVVVDGTVVVPDGYWVIEHSEAENCLRFVEPYSDGDAATRPWNFTVIRHNRVRNTLDSAILTAGSTNANYILAYDNQFIRDVGYTRRGSNFITSSAAIDLNGGRGHVIEQNRIEGEWSRGVYLYGNVSKVTVLNNTLVGITNSGAATGVPLDIEAGRYHRLIGNVITGSEGQGIYIHGARDITMVGNHVEDSAAGVGYQIASTGSVISSNIFAQGNVSIGNAKGFWDMDFTDNKSLRIFGNDIQGASTAYDFGDTAAGELTLRTWDTVGGTNQVATIGNLNVASNALNTTIGGKMNGQTNANQFGASTTLTIGSGALVTNLNARGLTLPTLTASRAAIIDANGNVTNVTSSSPSTEYVKADGTTGTPSSSGSGSTSNSIPVVTITTNITVGFGTFQSVTMLSASNQFLNLTGAATNGDAFEIAVTNTAATNISISLNTNGGAAVFYNPTVGTNDSAFGVAPGGRILEFVYSTNWGGIWRLNNYLGSERELVPGYGTTWATNGNYITNGVSTVLQGLHANAASTVTNTARGFGVSSAVSAGVLTATATNAITYAATNTTSLHVDWTGNEIVMVPLLLETNLVLIPTNMVIGRPLTVIARASGVTYNLSISNAAGTRILYPFGSTNSGNAALTVTNGQQIELNLLPLTNGISAAFGRFQ